MRILFQCLCPINFLFYISIVYTRNKKHTHLGGFPSGVSSPHSLFQGSWLRGRFEWSVHGFGYSRILFFLSQVEECSLNRDEDFLPVDVLWRWILELSNKGTSINSFTPLFTDTRVN